ncbi:MAG: type II toxin-antitoxin system PemK/MazF family toxin [Chloroflexota bacterium]
MANHSATKFKIVLVPFPFDDLSGNKVRPAVCLTEPVGAYRHVVLAFITSRIPTVLLPTDLVIEASHPDFSSTGLRLSSTLQLHRMMTATTDIILRELGELPPEMQDQIKGRLRRMFDL